MKTPVCELLGIDFPLLAFSHCRDVVAAVTNAGAFGVLGAMRYARTSWRWRCAGSMNRSAASPTASP